MNFKTRLLCSSQIYIHYNVWVTEASSSRLVRFQACNLKCEMRVRFLIYGRVHLPYITVSWLFLNHIDIYDAPITEQDV
jgi:hypothetical protein